MDNSLSESARFAVYREKLKGICEANNLSYVFIKNAYPIKLVIRPLGGVGEQMSMLEEATEDNYISPGASILFTVKDGNLTYRMSKTFTISDTLFNKIKNIFKNMHYLWLQFFFRDLVEGCQLAALTNYMFELRRDFVTQLSTAECKKHLGEIVRFAVDAFDSNYDGELTIKLLGVAPPETDGVDLLDYLESTSVFSDQPEKALLSLAYSAADDGSNGYWGWVWKPDYQSGGYGWEENGRLDAIYTLLVALGYEMSDEEKALQNGTHAIFSTNAPKKADAPCDLCKAAHPNCDKCCKACDEPCNAVQDCKKNEERTENDE